MTSKASEQELGNVKTVQIGREVTEVASIPGDEVDILLNYTYYHGKVQHSPKMQYLRVTTYIMAGVGENYKIGQ